MSWIDKFKPKTSQPQKIEPEVKEPEVPLVVASQEPEVYEDKPQVPLQRAPESSQISYSEENEEELSDEDKEIAELENKKAQLLEAKRLKEERKQKEFIEQESVSNEELPNLQNILMDFEERLTNIEATLFRLKVGLK